LFMGAGPEDSFLFVKRRLYFQLAPRGTVPVTIDSICRTIAGNRLRPRRAAGQPIRMSGLWERRDPRIVQPERR
jgi:hypothetical protein